MRRLVIDASVAAKWFLPAPREPLTDEALELFRQYANDEVRFLVPGLFWAEFGNILWKALRQGRCTRATAQSAIATIQDCHLPTVPSERLLEVAFAIAAAFNRSVYDGIYVALAVESEAELITADQRLANALSGRFPVKWLSAM